MKHRKLNKEETKKWTTIYWALIEKGLSQIEAYTLTTNRIHREDKKVKKISVKMLKKEIELMKAQNNPFLNALLEATNWHKLLNLHKKVRRI